MSSPQTRLENRYGVSKSASRSRTRKAALGVLTIGFLAVVVWVAVTFISGNQVKAETLRYKHINRTQIEVDFSLTMPPGTAATCGVEALNSNRAQVGFTVVDIPPQKERVTSHRIVITTQQEAVSGTVKKCEAAQ